MEGPIVVGIDGSPSSRDALLWAIHEARCRGASVTAVSAWMVPREAYWGALIPSSLPADLERAAAKVLATMVHELETEAQGVQVVPKVLEGEPAEVLIEKAKDAQMLVVGSRGLGGFRELLLGSVSQQCAHHATCPVVIIRHTTAEEAADHPGT
jgi:nucleotide-binding universal stress UspA family protein